MSLIVARIENNQISIVSDTKLSDPKGHERSSRDIKLLSEGVIKSTIISNEVCISFAGAVNEAENTIKLINKQLPIEEIIDILFYSHQNSQQSTDYIIAVAKPLPQIIEIKDSTCREVSSSWIGSHNAFKRFQQFTLEALKGSNTQTSFFNVTPSIENKPSDYFMKMSDSMDGVIADSDIPEVSGFKVHVAYIDNSFQFREYYHSYPGHIEIEGTLTHEDPSVIIPLNMNGTAASGGYTVNFFTSNGNFNEVGVHIQQGEYGIIYSRKENGILRPEVKRNIDELDFLEYAKTNYDLTPILISQNKEKKYFELAHKYFNERNYPEALRCINVALESSVGRNKAECYFRKAVTLLNLNRGQEAMNTFQKAINLDTSYQKKAFMVFNK